VWVAAGPTTDSDEIPVAGILMLTDHICQPLRNAREDLTASVRIGSDPAQLKSDLPICCA
jgi:hypothetical protein